MLDPVLAIIAALTSNLVVEGEVDVGGSSCIGYHACSGGNKVTVGNGSCLGDQACKVGPIGGATIGNNKDLTVGDNSCTADFSCRNQGDGTSGIPIRVTIGSGSYNCRGCCYNCTDGTDIGDNACSAGMGNPVDCCQTV